MHAAIGSSHLMTLLTWKEQTLSLQKMQTFSLHMSERRSRQFCVRIRASVRVRRGCQSEFHPSEASIIHSQFAAATRTRNSQARSHLAVR